MKISLRMGVMKWNKIAEHFHKHPLLSDVIALKQQWVITKRTLASRCKGVSLQQLVKFFFDNADKDTDHFSDCAVVRVLSIPLSSVDCERG